MGNLSTSEGQINIRENRSGKNGQGNRKHWAQNTQTKTKKQKNKQKTTTATQKTKTMSNTNPTKFLKWGQVSRNDRVVGM
jgi:3-oxoacyl-[acyl-carrier-protein] synthase III